MELFTGPGPTRAATSPSCASAFAGGGRLERIAAAKMIAATRMISELTRRLSSFAVGGPISGLSRPYRAVFGRIWKVGVVRVIAPAIRGAVPAPGSPYSLGEPA